MAVKRKKGVNLELCDYIIRGILNGSFYKASPPVSVLKPPAPMYLTRYSRQKPLELSRYLTRHLHSSSSSTTETTPSKLYGYYGFKPPPSLSPTPENPNKNFEKKAKPRYRPSSSLDSPKKKHSDLPFDFRYSYTESSPTVRPIGLREPKYSPFGPGQLDREWTGVCAPAVNTKVKSVDEGADDPKLEEEKRIMRERIQGLPLNNAERKVLVETCHRNRTKRQINLGVLFLLLFFLPLKGVYTLKSIEDGIVRYPAKNY